MDDFQQLMLDPELLSFLKDLLVVLGIGLLMGIEREFSKGEGKESTEHTFAGIRTFPIVALIGYAAAHFAEVYSPWVYVACIAGTFALTALSFVHSSRQGDRGGTSEFALIAVFLLGGLVVQGNYHGAVSIAVAVTALLALKVRMHSFVGNLTKNELYSILIMVVVTALVMPLLPREDFGPYGTLNLYKAWLIVVIFVTLNFVAYFLEKFLGSRRSVLITGIVGGFASSTATSWFFSRKAGQSKKGGILESAAIIFASAIMFPRLLIWLIILDRHLLGMLWVPITLFGLLGIGLGLWVSRRAQEKKVEQSPRQSSNPINFREAFVFAGIYIVIQLLVGFANEQFGDRGVYIASVIAGLTDIDAITISMSDYEQKSIGDQVAAIAIVMAAFSNTIIKYAFCLIFGNRAMRINSSIGFVPLFLAGIGYILYHFLVR